MRKTISNEMTHMKQHIIAGIGLLLVSAGFLWTEDASGSTDAELIAKTMREFNIRRIYPSSISACDDSYCWNVPINGICGQAPDNIIIPPFPADGLIARLLEDHPEDAVYFVRTIAKTFWSQRTCIYNTYVNIEQFNGLDGVEGDAVNTNGSNLNYPSGTCYLNSYFDGINNGTNVFPTMDSPNLDGTFDEITTANYRDRLNTLYQDITNRLVCKWLSVEYEEFELPIGCSSGFWFEPLPPVSCGELKNQALNAWSGHDRSTYGFSNEYTQIGVLEYAVLCYGYGYGYSQLSSYRGRITKNLSGHTGSAKCYICIIPRAMGWSNIPEGLSNDTEFHHWGTLTTGENWVSADLAYYPSGSPPSFSAECGSCENINPLSDAARGWKYSKAFIFVWPVFIANPQPWSEEKAGNPTYHKSKDPGIVYSVHENCDHQDGETVEGYVDYPFEGVKAISVSLLKPYFDTTAATLDLQNGSSYITLDGTDHEKCASGSDNKLKFSVRGKKGRTKITFRLMFWKQYYPPNQTSITDLATFCASNDYTINVRENHYNCCSGQDKPGGCWRGDTVFEEPTIKKQANEAVEVYFSQPNEAYILQIGTSTLTHCGFLNTVQQTEIKPTYTMILNGPSSNENVTLNSHVIIWVSPNVGYCYSVPSSWWNSSNHSVSGTFLWRVYKDNSSNIHMENAAEYSGNLRTFLRSKAPDSGNERYVEYKYDDTINHPDRVTRIIEHGDAINGDTEIRTHQVTYDANGKIASITGGVGCVPCGGLTNGLNTTCTLDANGNTSELKDLQGNTIRSFVYDSNGELQNEYLGPISEGKIVSSIQGEQQVRDIKRYYDSDKWTFAREVLDNVGRVVQRMEYESVFQGQETPSGRVFTEQIQYQDQVNGTTTTKTVIPHGGSMNGIRRVYNSVITNSRTRTDTETWYDSKGISHPMNDTTFGEVSYNSSNWRITKSTIFGASQNSAVTSYQYNAMNNVQYVIQPPIIGGEGISGAQQLKVEYTYDLQMADRVTKEKKIKVVGSTSTTQQEITYEYTAFGKPKKKTISNADGTKKQISYYLYNGFDQVILAKSPEGVVSGKVYDTAGRVISEFVLADPLADEVDIENFQKGPYLDKIDMSKTAENRYLLVSQIRYYYDDDATNNHKGWLLKVKKVKHDGPFRFGEPGNPTGVTWITTQYGYDDYGRRTSVTEDVSGANLTTTYEYDYQGQVWKVTKPNGQWTETYRDGRGLVSAEISGYGEGANRTQVGLTQYVYDAHRNLLRRVEADNSMTLYRYDDFDRVKMVRKGLTYNN
jgi:YD repeat-containing protein